MNLSESELYWQRMVEGIKLYLGYGDPALLLCSLCGSALLIVLITVKREEAKYPTTAAMALCSLLVADIGFLTISLLDDFVEIGVIPDFKSQSQKVCQAYGFASIFLLTVQSYIQAVISIERLLAVVRPMKVRDYITTCCMICLLLLAAGISCCISIGNVFYFTIAYKNHPRQNTTFCLLEANTQLHKRLLSTIAWIVLPTVIMILCTAGIIQTLITRSKQFKKGLHFTKISYAEMRLLFMLIALNSTFILTSVPVCVLNTLPQCNKL